MGYLDDIEPGVKRWLEHRRLFLREMEPPPAYPDEFVILVCWDDGLDDSGLPVGHVRRTRYRRGGLMGRTVEYWTAHALGLNHPTERSEVATSLPNISEAVSEVILHIPLRYS
ncbi:hypothetical protein SAZ11_47070 [Streptomyces sp. FXJ1.4098]|uniref:hypothetical protein n=1 Tax=Streptomyces sp. NPDC020845 TaxID=3365096 RepID=UPI002991335F|nr:hypothetical protein [Streptomyces sp. FXJ1.4098]